MKSPRIVFMGTPDFAAHILSALHAEAHQIAAVVTSPDKPAGRGRKIQGSAVKQQAEQFGLPVLQPVNLKDPLFLQALQDLRADLFIVVAFRMLPESVWNLPPMGTINLHASLLPQYRGAAPIQWAIIRGETSTGVTTFFIEKDIDTGKILGSRQVPILPEDTGGSLHDKLMHEGALLLTETIHQVYSGDYQAISQKNLISDPDKLEKAPKIFKQDCEICWEKSGREISNLVRGLNPVPSARTLLQPQDEAPFSLKVFSVRTEPFSAEESFPPPGTPESDGKTFLRIAAADAWVYLLEIQPEGKKRMEITAFLRGLRAIRWKIPE